MSKDVISTSPLPPGQGTAGSALKENPNQLLEVKLRSSRLTFKLVEGCLQVVAMPVCLRAVGAVAPPQFSPCATIIACIRLEGVGAFEVHEDTVQEIPAD